MKNIYKILVCLLLLTFYDCPMYSQSGFNKVVNFEGDRSNNFDGIQLFKNKLYVCGNTLLDSSLWGVSISVFDTLGKRLWEKTFLDSLKTSHLIANTPSSLHVNQDGNIIIPYNAFNRGNLGVIILDSLGNELNRSEFVNDQLTIYPIDVLDYGKDIYLFGHIQKTNYFLDLYVLKTDSIGTFKWIKYYGSAGWDDGFGNVFDNRNGTFTISSSTHNPAYDEEPIGSKGWIRPWIFTIDTSGNKVWEWRGLQNDPDTHGGPAYRLKNGDWIVASHEYKWNNQHEYWFNASLPTITLFDSLFNRKWKIVYMDRFYGFWDRIINIQFDSVKNEIITIGQRTYDYSFDYGELEPWILKINMDGEITQDICDTVISGIDNEVTHFTGGGVLALSRSLYAVGRVEALGREFGWILKMTPDGCIDTLCVTTPVSEPVPKRTQLNVYPNPVSDYMTIEVPEPLTSLRVYDLTGNLVYSLSPGLTTYSKIDTHSFSNGIYIIVGKKQDRSIVTSKFVVAQQ